jgi:hypothetical protein
MSVVPVKLATNPVKVLLYLPCCFISILLPIGKVYILSSNKVTGVPGGYISYSNPLIFSTFVSTNLKSEILYYTCPKQNT